MADDLNFEKEFEALSHEEQKRVLNMYGSPEAYEAERRLAAGVRSSLQAEPAPVGGVEGMDALMTRVRLPKPLHMIPLPLYQVAAAAILFLVLGWWLHRWTDRPAHPGQAAFAAVPDTVVREVTVRDTVFLRDTTQAKAAEPEASPQPPARKRRRKKQPVSDKLADTMEQFPDPKIMRKTGSRPARNLRMVADSPVMNDGFIGGMQ